MVEKKEKKSKFESMIPCHKCGKISNNLELDGNKFKEVSDEREIISEWFCSECYGDLKNITQKIQADFENYRKQTEKRMIEIREMANRDLILQLLPVLDNFELALKNVCADSDSFIQGVELIYSQLFSLLETNNIQMIKTENKTFDPYYHEALIKVDSELPENTIVEELQKGFILHGKVIRNARVKISNGKKGSDEKNNTLEE